MDRRTREFLAIAAKAKAEAMVSATEVTEHLYRSLLALPEFTLTDGTTGRIDAYMEPDMNEDGQPQCGLDVLLSNGSHLEFTVTNTGWGKALGAPRRRPPDAARGR